MRTARLQPTSSSHAGRALSRTQQTVSPLLARRRPTRPFLPASAPLRQLQQHQVFVPRASAAGLTAGSNPESNGQHSVTAAAKGTRPFWSRLTSPWDKEIFALAVPAMLSVLLDPVMGMVDTAIVGRLGTEPLAAVGMSTVLYNFSNFIWNFLLYTTTPRIAAAASKGNKDDVSKITSQGLWVAAAIGTTMTTLLWLNCPSMFASMGATPEVLAHAVPYLRGRCIASPAILMFYVVAGTFRGFKDTTTPLMAGIISNIVHLGLDVALVFWLGWGVTGAALATSLSHWLTVLILLGLVINKGHLKVKHLARPPRWSDVAPTLRNGLLLSTRSLLAMSTLLFATQLIAGFGAVALASHEILRQIWVLSNQAFTSLDVATQSLVASFLGKNDRVSAAAVFRRTLALATGVAVAVTAGLLLGQHNIPTIFTKDVAVVSQVAILMPLIAVFMPLDAAASVMDGVLLGSQEAAWLSRTMIVTASVAAIALLSCQRMGWGIFAIWASIKLLTVGRLIGNAWLLWSPQGPLGEHIRHFKPQQGSVALAMSTLQPE